MDSTILPEIDVNADKDRAYNPIIDLQLKKCNIISAVGSIDIRGILVELNYFEDIFSNCISGSILVNDTKGLHNKFSFCGEETLLLSFNKPGSGGSISRIFRIFSISDRRFVSNTNESYILNFCSEELLLNQRIRISKTYTNMRISDMVYKIATEYLKVDPQDFPQSNIEPTFGNYTITIPNLKPLQAINWLCNLAISNELPQNKKSGASYLFWQNKNGYHFKSILGIYNNVGSNLYTGPNLDENSFYWYGTKNLFLQLKSPTEGQSGALDDRQHILSFKNVDSYDSLKSARSGMFANKSIGIDYLTRKRDDVKFDYDQYFNGYLTQNIETFKNENKHPVLSNAKDRFNKTGNEYHDGIIKITPTKIEQNKQKYINGANGVFQDFNVQYTTSYRFAQLGLSGYNRFKMVIPGDNSICVGNLIRIKIPQADQKVTGTGNDYQLMDRFLSGIYLVSCVRHMITNENNFETILEVRKESYTSDISHVGEGYIMGGLVDFDNSMHNDIKSKGQF